MQPVENYSECHVVGLPVKIVTDFDLVNSTPQIYRREISRFCRSIAKLDVKCMGFDGIYRMQGDHYRLVMTKDTKKSLQKALTFIHEIPENYKATYTSLSEKFTKYLDTKPFCRCAVAIGSGGYPDDEFEEDPVNDLGFVYVRVVGVLKYYDEKISKGEKIKAVFISLLSNFDVIINISESVICMTEGQTEWDQLRNDIIREWDELVLEMRSELEDLGNWDQTGLCCVFTWSANLASRGKKLAELCKQYLSVNPDADKAKKITLLDKFAEMIENNRLLKTQKAAMAEE